MRAQDGKGMKGNRRVSVGRSGQDGEGDAESGQDTGAGRRPKNSLSNLHQFFFTDHFCETYRNHYFPFLSPPPKIKLLLPPCVCFPPAFLIRLGSQLWHPSLLPHFSIPPSVLYLPSYPQSLCVSSPATAMYEAFLLKLLPLETEHRNSQRIQAARLALGGSGSL